MLGSNKLLYYYQRSKVAVCLMPVKNVCVFFTFSQDLWNLGVAGAEGAVDLEAVGVIQERAAQGEEHFLWKQTSTSGITFSLVRQISKCLNCV